MDSKTTKVVNLRTDEYDVYIGRAGKGLTGYFGNPARFDKRCPLCGRIHRDTVEGRQDLLMCYEKYFDRRMLDDETFFNRVLELRGKRLGCFCKPKPCHGDVIAGWLEDHTEYFNRVEDYMNTLSDDTGVP